jgi:hypothetical protein
VTASYPGVVATNVAGTFSVVVQAGSGVGTVTPTGTPALPHNVAVRITGSGNVADSTAVWQTSFDAGPWITQAGNSAVVGDGITVTLGDNGGNPGFILDAVLLLSISGHRHHRGRIGHRDAAGARHALSRLWPSLAFPQDSDGNWIPISPTESAYVALALSANGQVVIAFVIPNGTVNNQVDIYICGQGGAILPPTTLANVQSFFDAWSMVTDKPNVTSPTPVILTPAFSGAGAITVKSAQRVAAAGRDSEALPELRRRRRPGREARDQRTRRPTRTVISLIRNTAGVTKVDDTLFTLNGVVGDVQLGAAPGNVPGRAAPQRLARLDRAVVEN